MASVYIGSTFISPLFGLISGVLSVQIFPIYLLFFALLMLFSFEKINQILKEKRIERELAKKIMP